MVEDREYDVQKDGFGLVRDALPADLLGALDEQLPANMHNRRNLLRVPVVRKVAASQAMRSLVEPVLGARCFAARAILFNKLQESNWKVPWHQDVVIAVRERREVEGYGPWSMKDGVPHVRPPAEVLAGMLAVRIHLDDSNEENGPLRFIPQSHMQSLMSDENIQNWPKENAVTVTARSGDVILMHPLVLHSSSRAQEPSARRVLHIEFAAADLPHGLEWAERV
jgi:ectoine hydroxylase-related dioxygenase (phytanoyl-CoA dioxygenase family)